MKKLILSVLAVVLIALTCPFANGQNNVWSLPPNYYKFGNIPPIIPLPKPQYMPDGITPNTINNPYDGYDGQVSEFSHNAMQDVNGDLLFFVVDGFVYDYNGHVIGGMDWGFGSNPILGYVETMIVPVP